MEEDILKRLENPKKMELTTLIRAFKREGIENFVVLRQNDFENLLNAYKEDEKVIDKLCSDIALDFGYWKEDVIESYRKKVRDE